MSKKDLKVKVVIGIPGAGKSTWCKKFIAENKDYIRVNRDDFRSMFKDNFVPDGKVEELITIVSNQAILSALNSNFNVLIDNTHLRLCYINDIIKLVKHKADIEFHIFDIDLETAIDRDSKRDRVVGANVIKKMYANYKNLIKEFNFETIKREVKIYDGNIKQSDLPQAIICDLDGTLAHHNGKRGIFDWNKCDIDDVDHYIKQELILKKSVGYKIIIMTGRDGAAKESTERWLNNNNIPYDLLLLKGINDNRKDVVVKKELYDNHVKDYYCVTTVYDDRNKIVELFRGMGLKTFQVNDGDF